MGVAVAKGLGLSDRRQSQPLGEQPQAGRETQPSRNTEGGDGGQTATPQALGQPRRVGKARWEGTVTRASSWRHGAAECPQMAMSLMAEQLAALSGGPAPLQWDQGQSSRGTLKTPTLTGSAHLHTHHTDTHSGTDMTQVTKTLPASGQSPSSESLPKSLVQAKGWGKAGFASRPCAASVADCGGQRSRTPGLH